MTMANSMSVYRQNGVDYTIDDPTVAPVFVDNADYPAGKHVKHEGNLYRFNTDHTAGAWNASEVSQVVLADEVTDLKSAFNSLENMEPQSLLDSATWVNKYVSPGSGSIYDSSTFILTSEPIPTHGLAKLDYTIQNGYKIRIQYYNSSKAHINGTYSWLTGNGSDTVVSNGEYFTVEIRKTDESDITTSDSDKADVVIFSKIVDTINRLIAADEAPITNVNYYNFITWGNTTGTYKAHGNQIYIPEGNSTYVRPALDYTLVGATNKIKVSFKSDRDTNISYRITAAPGGYATDVNFVRDGNIYSAEIPINSFSSASKYLTLWFNGKTNDDYRVWDIVISRDDEVFEPIKPDTYFVAATGSDSLGDGSFLFPFATVTNAIAHGAKCVSVASGVYNQQIDLSGADGELVIVNQTPKERVIFRDPDCVIATEETAVSGTTKVYSATISRQFGSNQKWLYQDGIVDVATEIADAERMPQQRSMTYRCEDTKITKCSATSVSAAITEIESADNYRWYVDATNNVLYFSRPATVTENNPICAASYTNDGNTGKRLFVNIEKVNDLQLKVIGIESKYMAMDIRTMRGAELIDCKASNVYDTGAFIYDSAVGCKFVRCEAVRAQQGIAGDGFNGSSLGVNTAAKFNTATLEDCWSHDNSDDGYSDHENCEVAIYGGLYEYNGKAGLTPANGTHCVGYNIYSRQNYRGFFYGGNGAQGQAGECIFYGCVAENNNRGETIADSATHAGFEVNGTGNKMALVGCKAINNGIGYQASSGNTLVLMDCSGSGNTTGKGGSGTITIKNTELIT